MLPLRRAPTALRGPDPSGPRSAGVRVLGPAIQGTGDDLIAGLVRLMESDFAGPVNLGNPAEFTVLDFAMLVRDLTQSDSRIEFRPLPVDDPKRRRPDISLAKSVLGWEPRVPVPIGLTHTITYFRQELERHRIATLEPALAVAQVAD